MKPIYVKLSDRNPKDVQLAQLIEIHKDHINISAAVRTLLFDYLSSFRPGETSPPRALPSGEHQ